MQFFIFKVNIQRGLYLELQVEGQNASQNLGSSRSWPPHVSLNITDNCQLSHHHLSQHNTLTLIVVFRIHSWVSQNVSYNTPVPETVSLTLNITMIQTVMMTPILLRWLSWTITATARVSTLGMQRWGHQCWTTGAGRTGGRWLLSLGKDYYFYVRSIERYEQLVRQSPVHKLLETILG